MSIIERIKSIFVDPELKAKPESRELARSVIDDIKRVDPSKWTHPVVEKDSARYGELKGLYGFVKFVDGKPVDDPDHPFEDLYVYQHPDLKYRLWRYPGALYPEGSEGKITSRDLHRMVKAFYVSRHSQL